MSVSVEGAFRHRLATGVLSLLGTGAVLSQWAYEALHTSQLGWDFPVFYIAASLPVKNLYNRTDFLAYWTVHLAPIGVPHWAPYVRLGAFSFLLKPLAHIAYYPALGWWLAAGLTAYLVAVILMLRQRQLPGFLLPACAAFFPAAAGLISGADTSLLLLVLVLAWISLERSCEMLAGVALSLCLCKFNLIILLPLVLLLQRRYRALACFAAGGAVILAISFWLTPIRTYLEALQDAQSKTAGFYPVGLRGFSTAIGSPGIYPVLAVLTIAVCWWLIRRLPLTESLCIGLIGSLMISPYVTWYDSTVLVLPIMIVFARAGLWVRTACIATLVAVPLWRHGGGNNGPIGFMHIAVELLLLASFVAQARGIRIASLKRLDTAPLWN